MTVQIPAPIAKRAPDGRLTPRRMRRILIDLSMRRIQPGTGSSHEFLMRRTADTQWPDLRKILAGFNWVVIGGVATRAFMAERLTKDMDVLVSIEDGEDVIARLKEAGYRVVSRLAIDGYLLIAPDGVEVDVLFGKQPWLLDALHHPDYDAAGYPVIPLPYLIVMKLKASRPQDVADISRMLGWADDSTLDEVRRIIAKYLPEDLEDLEAMIVLGQYEKELPDEQL